MINVIILYSIIVTINIFWVFSFFVRLVGLETKKWSTTHSIFQIINLLPRTIGILQIPLITLYTESAINKKEGINTIFYQGVIFFNLIGVLIGFFLLPILLSSLRSVIDNIYDNASFKVIFNKKLWTKIRKSFDVMGYKSFFTGFSFFKNYRSKLLINNSIASFLTAIAFPACILAGYHVPVYRATIISSVSIIYGLSTFINILLIDTRMSVLTDQTYHGSITLTYFKVVLFDCLKGRIIGIIIAIITLPYISGLIVIVIKYWLNLK